MTNTIQVPRELLEQFRFELDRIASISAQRMSDRIGELLTQPAAPADGELPGMWHESDLSGGETDCAPAPCESCNGTGSDGGRTHIDGSYEAYKCESCDGFGTKQPADVEEVEVLAWMWRDINGDVQFNYMHPEGKPLMTVSQHQRMMAQQWQSGYDEGRRMGTKARLSEVEQLNDQLAQRDAAIEEWSGTAVQNGMECDRLNAELAQRDAKLAASEARLHEVATLCATTEQKLAALIEDRARFPDRPDFIGNMISAHIGNLKAGKLDAEQYARKWRNELDGEIRRADALETKLAGVVEALRDTAAVAITMLYDIHPADVMEEFKIIELEDVVKVTDSLKNQKVERVYRRAWDAALAACDVESPKTPA